MNKVDMEVFSLGRFMVRKEGEVISEQSSGADKLWILFQYLLSHPFETVATERIIDDLDFEMELVDARNALENRIYRLRRLLARGEKYRTDRYISFSQGGYSLNWENGGWYDIGDFITGCERGDELLARGERDRAVDRFLRSLELYQGDYLNSRYNLPWVVTRRVRYRQLYLDSVIKTAELLGEKEELGEVERLLERATEIEPFQEDLQELYLQTLIKKGEKTRARRYYSFLVTLFAQKGVKPFAGLDWDEYSAELEMRRAEKELARELERDEHAEIDEILAGLEEEEVDDVKFLSPDVFRDIMALEKRRSLREESGEVYIARLGLNFLGDGEAGEEEISEHNQNLKESIASSLRSCDIVCQCGRGAFFLLFSGLELKQVEKVLSRINGQIMERGAVGDFILNNSLRKI